jgi:class 3 adenylate cyclase
MQRLLEASDVGILEGERLALTVLYGDLRNSTRLAETVDPKRLVEFLNDFLAKMAEVILEHEGTLDKFMGDEVMAIFGAPLPMNDHALRAVQVGLEMQEAHGEIRRKWTGEGLEVPLLGVGIATGEMIVGELGSGRRSDYTVLGAPANLGARIQGIAQGGQVLVSSDTHALLGERAEARPLPPVRFKGIAEHVTVYEVTGLR